jgi:hypothetical protein
MRAEGKYDPEGNPVYGVRGTTAMVVVSVPEKLRKPAEAGSTPEPGGGKEPASGEEPKVH